jgi:hypothetical protein
LIVIKFWIAQELNKKYMELKSGEGYSIEFCIKLKAVISHHKYHSQKNVLQEMK